MRDASATGKRPRAEEEGATPFASSSPRPFPRPSVDANPSPVSFAPSKARRGASATATPSAGAASADAPVEIDGSMLPDKFVKIEEIENTKLQEAYDAYMRHNHDQLQELLPDELPWSEVQVKHFTARNCRGVVLMHYPPRAECGGHTNVALVRHDSATKKAANGEVVHRIKSRCILLHGYAVAEWLLEPGERHGSEVVRVRNDAGEDTQVFVDSRSALALDFDHLELFPTFTENTVDVRGELGRKYGKEFSDEYMAEAGRVYAALGVARQAQVASQTGVTPPLFLWNAGVSEEGGDFSGAQVIVRNALRDDRECDDALVFSSHHPSFFMRGNTVAKLAAKYADDAAKAFVERIRAPTEVTPVAQSSGFWARFLHVADMTEEERERMRVEHAEFMQDMRRTWEAMVAAVKLVEDLVRQRKVPSPEQWAAADAARPSVERWREANAKRGEAMKANFAAVKLVEDLVRQRKVPSPEQWAAADAARPSVERWRSGRETFQAMVAAVELVEDLVRQRKVPSAEQWAAADAARPSVERWRAGIAKGAETFQAMVAAVELVERLVLEGLEPSDEERAAADAARASVERWREVIAKARAKAAETKKANTAAVKLVEDLEREQKDPTPEQRAAADAARASVERRREARAKASAKAAETKKAKLPAPTLVGEPIFFSAADRDFFC